MRIECHVYRSIKSILGFHSDGTRPFLVQKKRPAFALLEGRVAHCFTVELYGTFVGHEHRAAEVGPGRQLFSDALEDPFAETFALMTGKDIDVCEVGERDFVCDQASEAYLRWPSTACRGQYRVESSNVKWLSI